MRAAVHITQCRDVPPARLKCSCSVGIDTFTPYLYGKKEFESRQGLHLYDFLARTYAPDEARFWQPDPMAGDYHGISPYVFCGADPINNIDPNGRYIAVLFADGLIGHLGLLIGTDDGLWLYYSVNGNNVSCCGCFIGGKRFNEVGIDGGWTSPQEFLDSEFNTKPNDKGDCDPNHTNYNYTEAYEITTTPEQDQKISEAFTNIAGEEYGLFSNNCAHAVQRSLEIGGIKVSQEQSSMLIQTSVSCSASIYITTPSFQPKNILPQNAYNSIIKHNPNGRRYEKSK